MVNAQAIEAILNSLEYNTRKEEKKIINYILKKYGLTRKPTIELSKEIAEKIIKGEICKEDFFADILNFIQPFALMLRDIYEFLNAYKTYTTCNAIIFKFNFEKMRRSLSFDISSFPREVIETLSKGEKIVKEELKFDEGIVKEILELGSADMEFCHKFAQALSYYWYMKIKYNYNNDKLEEKLNEFFKYLEKLVDALITKYGLEQYRKDVEINVVYFDFENFVPEFEKVGNYSRKIVVKNGIDYENITTANERYLAYRLNYIILLIQFWKRKYIRKPLWDNYNWKRYCWDDYNNISLNLLAPVNPFLDNFHKYEKPFYNLPKEYVLRSPDKFFNEIERCTDYYLELFRSKVTITKHIEEDIVDKLIEFVKLPYWKYRWYVYELWTLILVLYTLAEYCEIELNLIEKDNIAEINIPKANAKEPVAILRPKNSELCLEIWYQRKTYNPLTREGLQPDIRISVCNKYPPNDIIVIENKDRKDCKGSHIDRVIKKYAEGTTADAIFILNYENYLRKDLQGPISSKKCYHKNVLIFSNFKPTNFESLDFFKEKVVRFLFKKSKDKEKKKRATVDILVDVSDSMSWNAKPKILKSLLQVLYTTFEKFDYNIRIFTFNTDIVSENVSLDALEVIGGGTNLKKSFETYKTKYLDSNIDCIVIISDNDSKEYASNLINSEEKVLYINLDDIR